MLHTMPTSKGRKYIEDIQLRFAAVMRCSQISYVAQTNYQKVLLPTPAYCFCIGKPWDITTCLNLQHLLRTCCAETQGVYSASLICCRRMSANMTHISQMNLHRIRCYQQLLNAPECKPWDITTCLNCDICCSLAVGKHTAHIHLRFAAAMVFTNISYVKS
jgi:hypothetical protein